MKQLAVLGCMLMLSVVSYAQSIKADLLKMKDVYAKANTCQMEIQVKMYDDKSKLLQTHAGRVIKSKEHYFMEMLGRTVLANSRQTLIVDDSRKVMMYKKKSKDEHTSEDLFVAVDTSIFNSSKMQYIENTATQKTIRFTDEASAYSKIEITIEPGTNLLTQVVYYYKETQGDPGISKVVVSYSNIKLNKAVSTELFSEKKYAVFEKGVLKGVGARKDYKIIY